MSTWLTDGALSGFKERFGGIVITPRDAGYDDARTLFNAMIDKRPALIAQCVSDADVVEAVRFARENGAPTAVRGGGHSVAGMSTLDGGFVIDLRRLDGVSVDPEARTARVGGGSTWANFDGVARQHGLATTGGRVSTTGVAGLTLGGGSGWLERRFGLACDNLLEVELVTADGSVVTASENENADLFWALHGGGGNFGIATSLTFRMHPVDTVFAGLLLYDASKGEELMSVLRDMMADGPDELASAFLYLTAPPEPDVPEHLHNHLITAAAVCWSGAIDRGDDVIRPLRDLGPEADFMGPTAYADFNCSIDDPPGFRNYWTAEYVDDLPAEAISIVAEYGHSMSRGPAQTFLVPWGGEVGRVAEDATPLTKRDAAWVVHPFALWDDPAEDAANMAWGRNFAADIRKFATGGVYLNFIGDEGEDRIRAAYGEQKYNRLAEIKGRYDPDNFFRNNQNIKPKRLSTPVA
jgi:FAD/FMN-containing dehydrogenase